MKVHRITSAPNERKKSFFFDGRTYFLHYALHCSFERPDGKKGESKKKKQEHRCMFPSAIKSLSRRTRMGKKQTPSDVASFFIIKFLEHFRICIARLQSCNVDVFTPPKRDLLIKYGTVNHTGVGGRPGRHLAAAKNHKFSQEKLHLASFVQQQMPVGVQTLHLRKKKLKQKSGRGETRDTLHDMCMYRHINGKFLFASFHTGKCDFPDGVTQKNVCDLKWQERELHQTIIIDLSLGRIGKKARENRWRRQATVGIMTNGLRDESLSQVASRLNFHNSPDELQMSFEMGNTCFSLHTFENPLGKEE